MTDLSIITNSLKFQADEETFAGDVIFREVDLDPNRKAFFILVFSTTSASPDPDLPKKEADIFETVIDTFKTNLQLGNLESLKIAFSKGLDGLDQASAASIALIIDKTIYASTSGLAQVFLKRHGNFAPIVVNKPLPDAENSLESHIVRSSSGFWQPNDTLILTTNFSNTLQKELKNFNYSHETEELEAELRQKVDPDVLTDLQLAIVKLVPKEGVEKPEQAYDNLSPVSEDVLAPNPTPEEESIPEPEPVLRQAQPTPKKPIDFSFGLKKLLSDPKKSKRIYALGFLILSAILIARLGLSFAGFTSLAKAKEAENLLNEAKIDYQDGTSLITLNPPQARVKLTQSINKLNTVLSILPDNAEAKNYLDKAQKSITRTLNVKEAVIDNFLDLSLIKNGTIGHAMDLDGRVLNVLDTDAGSLIQVNIDRKSSEIVGGGDNIKGAEFVGGSLGRTFAYKKGIGVSRAKSGSTQTDLVIDDKNSGISSVTGIASFGGNLYELDPQANQVWKFAPTESSFSAKTNYISDSIARDISDSSDLSIDGSVWVLTKSQDIYNFLPGSGTSFPVSGLDKKIGPNAKIYADADSKDSIYVLDPDNARVLLFGKTGGYKLQYQDPKIADAIDFAVSEKDGVIFLLTKTSILTLKI